jgi:hypothetical protein
VQINTEHLQEGDNPVDPARRQHEPDFILRAIITPKDYLRFLRPINPPATIITKSIKIQ